MMFSMFMKKWSLEDFVVLAEAVEADKGDAAEYSPPAAQLPRADLHRRVLLLEWPYWATLTGTLGGAGT
jgi:hypothetical protein